ncbi:hypothetical protein BO71DRAFT_85960 [Aspergillus ellipticus CBS 707.79]|uniref:Uncharacterized protein n=1 Tax=Aspergillus ellipticus CBS 707.79 TaxID=1448320 RepID=A0A319F4I5_9EURO|nr:hypothetical protein BO71DRAFT_85960 [Aspergillus ellipticus CBS 707.79]
MNHAPGPPPLARQQTSPNPRVGLSSIVHRQVTEYKVDHYLQPIYGLLGIYVGPRSVCTVMPACPSTIHRAATESGVQSTTDGVPTYIHTYIVHKFPQRSLSHSGGLLSYFFLPSPVPVRGVEGGPAEVFLWQ